MKPTILLLGMLLFMGMNTSNLKAAPPLMTVDLWEDVEFFLDKFNKSKFIERVEQDKARYEQSVRWVKTNKHRIDAKTLTELTTKYQVTQTAYNEAMDLMLQDINGMVSLFTFLNTDPFQQYKARLKSASDNGREFLFHTYLTYLYLEKIRETPNENPHQYGIQAWVIAFAPEIISKAHDMYLDHLKNKMRVKLYNVRLLDWKDI